MRFSKLSMIAGFIIAFVLIFELAAHADEVNQLTNISFSETGASTGPTFAGGHLPVRLGRQYG